VNQLRNYLMVTVLKGVALVLLVIVTVGGFIELVGQLDDVGTADYGLAEAVSYVLLRVPRLIFDVLPMAALLGGLLGLGNMAVHRELIVMRASGVSHYRMLGALALAGFGLLVVMVLLGESFAPSLGAYAREMRTQALHDDVSIDNTQSTWLKDGDRIINLRRTEQGFGFDGGVFLFELDGGRDLRYVARADSTDIGPTNEWLLGNYAETAFTSEGVRTRRAATLRQSYDLSPDLLGLSVVRENLLDTPELQRYIRYLRSNNLDAQRYLIAYWSRMANIASVVLMTVLALPFVFGSLRSAGTGARMIVGLIIGLAYYVSVQVLAQGGQVFDLDPAVVAWTPSIALLLITTIALLRIR
jgi:lipopolysaccharide export system permease protein